MRKRVTYKSLNQTERLIYSELIKYAFPKYNVLIHVQDQAIACLTDANVELSFTFTDTILCIQSIETGSININSRKIYFDAGHNPYSLMSALKDRTPITIQFAVQEPIDEDDEYTHLKASGTLQGMTYSDNGHISLNMSVEAMVKELDT